MCYLPDNYISVNPIGPIMPTGLWNVLNAVAMNKFDPMIGYGYAMAITSALVQSYCRLQIGSSFITDLSLYFLTVAASASGKGAIFKPLYAPIKGLVAERINHDKDENKKRQAQNAALDVAIAEKKKQTRKMSGSALHLLIREIAELEVQRQPLLPEFVFDVQDITPAALLQQLQEQQTHSLLIADTEGRFMRSIDEDKSLSAMLNQTFSGEAVSNSRVSVRSIRVENPHVSIAAGVQPEKLGRLTKNPNLWGEGFIARVLPYFAIQPPITSGAIIGEIADHEIMNWWHKKVEMLFTTRVPQDDSGKAQPFLFELDATARQCYNAHCQQIHGMKLLPTYIGLQSNLARMPELTARLAAIYHILEHPSPFDAPVSVEMMHHAINASIFFLEQIRKLYAEFYPDPVVKLLPRLCGWLKSRVGTMSYVTAKDMYNGIGGNRDGLMRAIHLLWINGVLYPSTEYEPAPNFSGWTMIKSYGFLINFQLLQGYPG